ncbi:MAG: helix-turn-helix domain-containing protein [Phycisphaerales bacterium]|nr:helix-turn-helix domain-containing protein [Phycisphaerales bacterium]
MSPKQRTDREIAAGSSPPAPVFADQLRELRRRSGLSLAELAERVGCTSSYLSAIECAKKRHPADELIRRIETALGCAPGDLLTLAHWEQTPGPIRADYQVMHDQDQNAKQLARLLSRSAQQGRSLDDLYASGELRRAIDRVDPPSTPESHEAGDARSVRLANQVPLINKVTAGYPAGFTDLDYPARVADEYIRTPDLSDPDAFAARVVGDSMQPNYREGDIVVFSPAKAIESGSDCFVRFERDAESTFKRVYFETGEQGDELIRIQPINNAYAPKTVPREEIAGLYAGVSVIRAIG